MRKHKRMIVALIGMGAAVAYAVYSARPAHSTTLDDLNFQLEFNADEAEIRGIEAERNADAREDRIVRMMTQNTNAIIENQRFEREMANERRKIERIRRDIIEIERRTADDARE